MKERPILFSAPMVRGILEDRKTQTRRIVKPQPDWLPEVHSVERTDQMFWPLAGAGRGHQCGAPLVGCRLGLPGDVLWVKETWRMPDTFDPHSPTKAKSMVLPELAPNVFYEADGAIRSAGAATGRPGKTRVSIHMPRWASRIPLRITDVRVERLNEISEADALAEGIVEYDPTDEDPAEYAWDDERGRGAIYSSAAEAYAYLWRHINGPGSWAENPWVWALTFERLPQP